ncbi:MAG: HEAT repeat domain-containing protein [Cyanobacteriota bacterium]
MAEPPQPGSGAPISETEALERLRQTINQGDQYYAAWWLGRMRSQHPEAVPLLRQALAQRHQGSPGNGVEHNAVARNAARALGKLGPSAEAAIPDLLTTLDDDDDGLREAAARALGELQCREAAPVIARRLAPGPAVVGIRRTDSPRLVEPCEAMLEALGAIGLTTPEVLAVIEPFLGHDRPLIRSAASRALLQLSRDPRWADPLLDLLRHPQLQVRRAALMDLGAVGWRPALEPISRTLAENSLKLIALRGLVENHPPEAETTISTNAVLAVMDDLL